MMAANVCASIHKPQPKIDSRCLLVCGISVLPIVAFVLSVAVYPESLLQMVFSACRCSDELRVVYTVSSKGINYSHTNFYTTCIIFHCLQYPSQFSMLGYGSVAIKFNNLLAGV